jgi:hypothetical protein
MKLLLAYTIVLVSSLTANANECPTTSTRTVLADGTVKIARDSGMVVTISPTKQINYYTEWRDDAHRAEMMRVCNWDTPSPVRPAVTTRITSLTGSTIGYIRN